MSDGLCIAHVHTTAGWGGGENQVLRLMTGLRERGVKAVLFARARGELLRRALGLGLPARSLPRLLAARHVARALAEEPFDVVHVHDSRAVAIGTRAARARGIPVVASRRVASPLRRNPVSHRKYSPRRLAAIIAISETVKRVVLHSGYPEERVFVAADAVDAGELDAVHADRSLMTGVSQGSLAVGIGRLSEKKNWGLLLGTAARMKANGRAMQWAVIGDGPLRRPLEHEARRLDLGDCVHFLGFRHDALSLLKGSDLLFFPSRMEGASVTVREAMVLGIPVVAAAAEGTVESLDGHGWLIEPDDAMAAAAAVAEVLDDDVRRRLICADARRSALARFSVEGMVEATLGVYARCRYGTAAGAAVTRKFACCVH